jgi:hypothetical protein
MNILLWILQVLLASLFIYQGIYHFIIPPCLLAACAGAAQNKATRRPAWKVC